jgi:hydrogenase-4 component F
MTAWLNPASGLLIFPAVSALVLVALPGYRASAWVNVIGALATLASALMLLVWRPDDLGPLLQVDDLCIVFLVLNTLVGFTTAIFSRTYISHEIDNGHLEARHVRFYHALYQMLLGAMNLALLTSVTGLMWVAIEIATLTTVLIVAMYRTHEALEAAWKYFILGSIGIALALFGTILVYSAAQPVIGDGLPAMTFAMMQTHAARFDPAILNLAFVFILLGYGTKAGLVPLHAWLPDAHAEGPTPISAVLSGLLLNVAIYAILRFKIVMAANPATIAPGPLMMTLGLASVVFAALMLYRRRDIKRLFAYSSIEHMGIIAFAFGLGGPLANFAGLLHMAMHSLTKSGVFFTVGHITGVKHTQKIAAITGLTTSHPRLGWIFVVSVVAIAGLPPFGLFTSEFLVVSSAFARYPWMAVILVLGLLIALGALFQRLNGIAFGEPSGSLEKDRISLVPIVIHLGIVLGAGIFLPGPLVAWFQHIAQILG